ncbi:MAG TPA: ABC transporter permease [Anaerolineales bacterium]|nr:ABC transporter permease [Anaerolineales bacterium]
MNFLDLLRLVVGNLSRRKARVALTAVGVIIGTAAVVILVSLAIGLQQTATDQLYGIGDLTQIQVSPSYGGEGVFIEAGGGGGGGVGFPASDEVKLLTNSVLEEFRAIPGVESVIPREYMMSAAVMKFQKMESYVNIIGIGTDDVADLGDEAEQGTTELGRGRIVIGITVPQGFYDPNMRPGQETPPPPELFDQQVQLIVFKYDANGNEIRKNITLRVTGVLKETRGESDFTVYMPLDQLKQLNEWSQNRRFNYNKDGYGMVIVKVGDVDKVIEIADQITAMGFQAFTPQSFLEGINNFFIVLQVIFGGIGAIALLVAAIGIANTMAMSILERTREIGLMKAVGATNRDVLAIFLGEAAGIGFLGGLGGVIVGWLASQGINVLATVYLANQASEQGGAPLNIAVSTPLWLPIFALVFSTLVGMFSGLYPALRAATMIPVLALKYE